MPGPPADWKLTPREAIELQRKLAQEVVKQDQWGPLHTVGGVDVGFEGESREIARAVVVTLSFPELELIEQVIVHRPVTFPYIPGLLSFRESSAILAAVGRLKSPPDLIIVDGHGYSHPRRFGIACHLGVLLDLPTIGCAKSRLVGQMTEPGAERGNWSPLLDKGEVIGAVLRTRPGTRPIFVSVGHRVSLEGAIRVVLECTRVYRLPETTRLAHRAASRRPIAL